MANRKEARSLDQVRSNVHNNRYKVEQNVVLKNETQLSNDRSYNMAIVQGIVAFQGLEQKLINAASQPMREKYEVELKREIKKLQRIRDMMRAAHNNPDMKEKSRYLDARKRIECVSAQCAGKAFITPFLQRSFCNLWQFLRFLTFCLFRRWRGSETLRKASKRSNFHRER